MRLLALLGTVLCAALLAAGCGGGSSSSSSTAPGAKEGGAPKKATAPNAPAGSRVVACKAGDTGATSELRATAVDCGTARATMARWGGTQACGLPAGASRGSCALAGFRCQTVKSDRGLAVSCAKPGGDVSFIARSWPLRSGGG
jgi:hypothetical protein